MREITFEKKVGALPIHTVLGYGDTRSGKTTWAATWPRPLFIADAIEHGYESILTSNRDTWFEPDGPDPIILAIETIADVAQLFATGGRIEQEIARGRCETIVFDALSYYVELALNHIIGLQDKADNRAAYGDLGKHLRAVRTMVHLKGRSVIWNCITKHPDDDDKRGRPSIPGKQGEAWPGAVDFVLRFQGKREVHMVDILDDDGKPTGRKARQIDESFFINTRTNGAYIAGNRLGTQADLLPDPFVGTYADLMATLGHDVDALRANLKAKKSGAMPAVSQPIARPVAKAPPVITQRSAPKVAAAPLQANNNTKR